MKRTWTAAISAAIAGTSIGLAGAPAYAMPKPQAEPMPSARLWIQPSKTYAGGGQFGVMSWCSQHQDLRVIITPILPHAVNLHKTGPLLIKVTNKTRPGQYNVTLWCINSQHQTDAIDVTQVTVQTRLKGWKQHWAGLPEHFRPTVMANSAPPPAPKQVKQPGKNHSKRHQG
jgi:hypothetical protein